MNNKLEIKNLFDCETAYIKPLFESYQYPWEILPNIKKYIETLIEKGLDNFTELKPGVWVGENVKISPLSTIEAPAIIGSGTEIRPGAYIRGSVLVGENCVLGNSSEFKNCVLLNKAQVPHFNYVGDSILGNYAHLGAGSICSNLKADKSNVVVKWGDIKLETGLRKFGAILADKADVGSGCVLNPGTVILKNTSVYPLQALRGVFPENSIVKTPQNVVERV